MLEETCGNCKELLVTKFLNVDVFGCKKTGCAVPHHVKSGDTTVTFHRIPKTCPRADVVKNDEVVHRDKWVIRNLNDWRKVSKMVKFEDMPRVEQFGLIVHVLDGGRLEIHAGDGQWVKCNHYLPELPDAVYRKHVPTELDEIDEQLKKLNARRDELLNF